MIVVKKSELNLIPPPFLDRFEKYTLSHRTVLQTVLEELPPHMEILLKLIYEKVCGFISAMNETSFYGMHNETVDSLLLSVLPSESYIYRKVFSTKELYKSKKVKVSLLGTLLCILRDNAGFHIPIHSEDELESDMEHFQELISGDKYFEHELNNMKESSILASVDGALSLLYSRQDQLPEVYTDSCMVISLLQQWLTKHLCDKMLQVMKPEALLVHHKALSLPAQKHFLRSYTKQGHFSLKDLINKQLDLLEINQNKGLCSNKLICFTRSTPLLHNLPTFYSNADKDTEETMSRLFSELMDSLMMIKVTSNLPQSKLEGMLLSFVNSNRNILVLVLQTWMTSQNQ